MLEMNLDPSFVSCWAAAIIIPAERESLTLASFGQMQALEALSKHRVPDGQHSTCVGIRQNSAFCFWLLLQLLTAISIHHIFSTSVLPPPPDDLQGRLKLELENSDIQTLKGILCTAEERSATVC